MKARVCLLPHLGLGDALVLYGMVKFMRDECVADGNEFALVCYRKYLDSLRTLFRKMPDLVLLPVDRVEDVSIAYGAKKTDFENFMKDNSVSAVLPIGYHHAGTGEWLGLADTWPHALYASAQLDPKLILDFELPAPQEGSKNMLEKVKEIVESRGKKGYVLVHDDAGRQLVLPEIDDQYAIIHVDDARIRSRNIFDYVDTLKNAEHMHCIDSCFAWLVDLGKLGTPMTIHAYSKDASMKNIYVNPETQVEILSKPP
jgi:hypothetical protein